MPINLAEIPEPLKEAARTGSLVPLVGSGVCAEARITDAGSSGQAKSPTKPPFPSWTELLLDLEDWAVHQKCITLEQQEEISRLAENGKYLMAAQD